MKYSQKLHNWLKQKPFTRWYVDVLLDEIERLQAERRWIPVSDRLPECGKAVLTIYHTKNGHGSVTLRCRVQDKEDLQKVIWYDVEHGHYVSENNVTHWMPLPEPQEEDK